MKAIATYENYYGESPHRFVALAFANEEDVTAYRGLEEIMAIEAEIDARAASRGIYIFQLRSDYINQ